MQGIFLGLFLVITSCVTSHCAVTNHDESALSLGTKEDQLDAKLSQILQNQHKLLHHNSVVTEKEKLIENMQAQMKELSEEMKSQAKIIEKLVTIITRQKEAASTEDEARETGTQIVTKRLIRLETLLEHIEDDNNEQSEALQNITGILTTDTKLYHQQQILQTEIGAMQQDLKTQIDARFQTLLTEIVATQQKLVRATVDNYGREVGQTGDKEIMKRACQLGVVSVVKALLDLGVNVSLKLNTDSWTCLHYAAGNNQVEVATLFLNNSADIEARNSEHNTPLIMAAAYGHLEVTRFLVERGADLGAKNNKGKTALAAAREQYRTLVVQYLEGKNAS